MGTSVTSEPQQDETARRLLDDAPRHWWCREREPGIVHVRVPVAPRKGDLEALCDATLQWLHTVRHPFTYLIDAGAMKNFPDRHRRVLTELDREAQPFDARWNKGQAVIVTSPYVRGIMTAFTWFSPPVYPMKAFKNTAAGLRWLRGQLGRPASAPPEDTF